MRESGAGDLMAPPSYSIRIERNRRVGYMANIVVKGSPPPGDPPPWPAPENESPALFALTRRGIKRKANRWIRRDAQDAARYRDAEIIQVEVD